MNNLTPIKRSIGPALALMALAAACCWLPVRSDAQTNPPSRQEQDHATIPVTDLSSETGTDKTNPKADEKSVKPLKDYRRRTLRKPSKEELPLFGYDFFRPAREIIEAHRAYLRKRYGITSSPTESRSGGRSSQSLKQNTARSRNTRLQNDGSRDLRDRSDESSDLQDDSGDWRIRSRDGSNDRRDRSGDGSDGSEQSNGRSGSKSYGSDDSGDLTDDNTDGSDLSQDGATQRGSHRRSVDSEQSGQEDENGMDAADDNGTDAGRASTFRKQRSDNGSDSQDDDSLQSSDTRSRSDDGSGDSSDDPADTNTRSTHKRSSANNEEDTQESGVTRKRGSNTTSDDRAGGSQNRQGRLRRDQDTQDDGFAPISDSGPAATDAYEQVSDPLTQLYRNVNATVPSNYQLAADDTLTIRFWSPRHEMQTLTRKVNAQGSVLLPGVGPVVVRALTLEQAEKVLRVQLRRYYNGVDVSVTLDKLRTIQITVTGMAFQPGTYTVPAVATAYNVLYAAGGPTEQGSLRNIEVRRSGKLIGTLDVYNFLTIGSQAGDIALQAGDLIHIPPRQSQVAVSGEVLQPAIYELRRSETLHDALRFAGGVKPSGVDQHIQINTIVPGSTRLLKDINLQNPSTASAVPLFDGDSVEIFSVRPLLANQVTVEGAVDQPNDYALEPGMRVADLLQRARGLLPNAYATRADLLRTNPDNTTTLIAINIEQALARTPDANVTLQPWDRLKVYSREEVAWTGRRSVSVRGAVQRPGIYDYSDQMHVSDLLLMAGGPTPNAFAERAILLHRHGDGSYAIDYVNLANVLHNDRSQDITLQDNDVLTVYRVGEAQFEPEHVVTIRGEVVKPGAYPRTEKMHLSDLLTLAGGFKPGSGSRVVVAHARQMLGSKNGALQTVSVLFDAQHRCAPQDDAQIEDGDVVTVQGSGDYQERVQVVNVQGAVKHPGPVVISSRSMRLSDALREAGGLLPQAYPQGAEFTRDPKLLMTTGQRSMAETIGKLNDLLNARAYSRERSKAYVERIKEVNAAERGSDSTLPIPGIGGGSSQPPSQVTGAIAAQLAQQETVSQPRRLTTELNPDGAIAVNLPAALQNPKGPDDLLLVDGDTITVPEKPTTVQVIGAVVHGRGVLYRAGSGVDYYVTLSGGLTSDAAPDRIEVIHVGGGMIPANKVHSLEPGDVILVPNKVMAETLSAHANSFDSFFRSLTSSAIILKVATSLFGL